MSGLLSSFWSTESQDQTVVDIPPPAYPVCVQLPYSGPPAYPGNSQSSSSEPPAYPGYGQSPSSRPPAYPGSTSPALSNGELGKDSTKTICGTCKSQVLLSSRLEVESTYSNI